MGPTNEQLVREMLEIFNRRGGRAAAEFALAPDVVWHSAPEWPGKQVYEGHEGALELIEEWTASFAEYRWDVDHAEEIGDRVLTLVHHRGNTGGASIEGPVGAVWRVEHGRVAEAWFFFSWEEARATAAAGQAVN